MPVDWNLEPAVLIASGWVDLVDGVVITPQLPTCHAHVYDYFVISKNLAHAVAGIQRIDDAGLFPHWPSRLLIRGDARRHLVRQLVRPDLVPGVLPAGPLPRPRLLFPHGIDASADAINIATAEWHSAAREEWRSLIGDLHPFCAPRFRWAPAAGPRADSVPDASLIGADCRQLAMRIEECGGALPAPTGAQSELIRRHVRRAFYLIAERRSRLSHEAFATQAVPWLCATVAALSRTDVGALRQLALIARLKATREDNTRRNQRRKEWSAWLNGGGSSVERCNCADSVDQACVLVCEGCAGLVRKPYRGG